MTVQTIILTSEKSASPSIFPTTFCVFSFTFRGILNLISEGLGQVKFLFIISRLIFLSNYTALLPKQVSMLFARFERFVNMQRFVSKHIYSHFTQLTSCKSLEPFEYHFKLISPEKYFISMIGRCTALLAWKNAINSSEVKR